MRDLAEKYASIMDRVSTFIGHACASLFFVCIIISAGEVLLRYGFNSPTVWSTEVNVTLCAVAWILSIGYVTERRRHISITMLELLVSAAVWRRLQLFQMPRTKERFRLSHSPKTSFPESFPMSIVFSVIHQQPPEPLPLSCVPQCQKGRVLFLDLALAQDLRQVLPRAPVDRVAQ